VGTVTCASSPLKAVYNPKAVIPHAALLHQACAHCAIFPTAASRRSLGRISVPVWPVALSGRLPVEALVSHYLTNKLIGREPILDRRSFPHLNMRRSVISGISSCFQLVSQSQGQVAHVLLTRSPLVYSRRSLTVRLACVKHAASVRPEPGSNSPLKNIDNHDTHHRHRSESSKTTSLTLTEPNSWVNQQSISKEPDTTQPTPH
jgi:hypothetical protein